MLLDIFYFVKDPSSHFVCGACWLAMPQWKDFLVIGQN